MVCRWVSEHVYGGYREGIGSCIRGIGGIGGIEGVPEQSVGFASIAPYGRRSGTSHRARRPVGGIVWYSVYSVYSVV